LAFGANSAIFSVVNAVLLRPLPYKNPGRLAMIWQSDLRRHGNSGPVAPANFVDWRDQNQVFERLAAINTFGSFILTGAGQEPERLQGATVSAGFFSILGVDAVAGRTFSDDEHVVGKDHVAVLSHELWERRFGANPNVIGKPLTLNGESYTVIGTLPRNFELVGRPSDFQLTTSQMDVWVPLTIGPNAPRGTHPFRVIGSLKPGVSVEQAQTGMTAIARRLEQQYPEFNLGSGIRVVPLSEQTAGDFRTALYVLLAAVGFVLLIACANVANLLLVRATARRREMAVRSALGATRARLVRQVFIESTLLAMAGAAAGLLLANWSQHALIALCPPGIPRIQQASLDARVLAFTFLIAVVAGIVFGFAPAGQILANGAMDALKEGGRSGTEGGRTSRVRDVLLVAQVALCLTLLTGAGLLVKSFWRLQRADPGFHTQNILAVDVSLPPATYPLKFRGPVAADGKPQDPFIGTSRVTGFYRQLLERAAGTPGVISVGAMNYLPLSGTNNAWSFEIEGRPPQPQGQHNMADWRAVSGDYFKTMGIPLRQGRAFTERDSALAPKVILINESMARRFWPGEQPVGRRLQIGGDDWREVVGLVADVKHSSLARDPVAEMYVPYSQSNSPWRDMTLVIRTTADPAGMATAASAAVHAIDPNLPVFNVRTMEKLVEASLSRPRFQMLLLTIFAGVALLLAMVGVYGVISYAVSRRTHEIGVRMALGAQPGSVLALVMSWGMRLIVIGLSFGLAASLALTRFLGAMLYTVEPTDGGPFATVALLLAGVGLVAIYFPARRAMLVDPTVALRYE
jgi:putative ABC transport system permease protein